MKWFQQNRWLGVFLIVFGICVLLAGFLFYSTRNKWSDVRQAFDKAAAERSRLQHLDPFPNDANYQKLKVHLENYGAALDKFKEELRKQVAPAPPLAPNEFQSRLRQAVVATLNRARANNVKLPDKFQLGFDEFTTAMPKTGVAPLVGQELSVRAVIDARGTATLTRGIAVAQYVSWTRGVLWFHDAPLRSVITQLGRWYDLDIGLGDSSLAAEPLTISFSRESADEALAALAKVLDVRVTRVGRSVQLNPIHPQHARREEE